MSTDDVYKAKRELKAVTSHGKRHNSTISGIGIFPEPLELPIKVRRTKEVKKKMYRYVENMTISINLNVKDIDNDETLLEKLMEKLGLDEVVNDFEVLDTSTKVLRALAKAKIRNVMTIKLDNETIYKNPDDYYDVDTAVDVIMMEIQDRKGDKGKAINMELVSANFEDLWVEAHVSKIHMPWTHDILIKFHGEMDGEYFIRVINYLEEHLDIENMEKEWKKA